jgi:enoyl-CoA hydratase
MSAVVLEHPEPEIAVITLSRPERLNAMNADLIEGLHAAFTEIEADHVCRVVVLTGAGRGFCSGFDVSGYGPMPGPSWMSGQQRMMILQKRIAALLPRMRSLSQPVIAAVNGPAVGGGLSLVLGSDIRLAAVQASFGAAFIRIGLSACDIGTSWLLPRIVGVARAQELMLTGRQFDSHEAYRIGMITHILEFEELLDAAIEMAKSICGNSQWGVALTKEGMWSALEIPSLQVAIDLENRQQVLLTTTDEFASAVAPFPGDDRSERPS